MELENAILGAEETEEEPFDFDELEKLWRVNVMPAGLPFSFPRKKKSRSETKNGFRRLWSG